MTIAMLIFGILTVVAAAGVIFAQKPLYSALSLVATLFLVAVHFALLGAQFIATLQILVYAGAIMVLVIFVIMLLGLDSSTRGFATNVYSYFMAVGSGVFVALLVFAVNSDFGGLLPARAVGDQLPDEAGFVESVGELLFTNYLYPFEIASLLLLAAIIGAVVLAQEEKRGLPEGRGLRAKQKERGVTG